MCMANPARSAAGIARARPSIPNLIVKITTAIGMVMSMARRAERQNGDEYQFRLRFRVGI